MYEHGSLAADAEMEQALGFGLGIARWEVTRIARPTFSLIRSSDPSKAVANNLALPPDKLTGGVSNNLALPPDKLTGDVSNNLALPPDKLTGGVSDIEMWVMARP